MEYFTHNLHINEKSMCITSITKYNVYECYNLLWFGDCEHGLKERLSDVFTWYTLHRRVPCAHHKAHKGDQ